MTEEQLKQVKFKFVSSLSLESEHIVTYASEDGRLGFCVHSKKKRNGDFVRSFRHYRIEGKVYKKREEFIDALKEFH